MKFTPNQPYRRFKVGLGKSTLLSDCGRVELAADEQVTFVTESGSEYDVCRKSWGFYATPSVNGRLKEFGLRAVLVRNEVQRYFVMLVEKDKEEEFLRYLESERNVIVMWLDQTEALEELFRQSQQRKSTPL
jgi:hypothetical protein